MALTSTFRLIRAKDKTDVRNVDQTFQPKFVLLLVIRRTHPWMSTQWQWQCWLLNESKINEKDTCNVFHDTQLILFILSHHFSYFRQSFNSKLGRPWHVAPCHRVGHGSIFKTTPGQNFWTNGTQTHWNLHLIQPNPSSTRDMVGLSLSTCENCTANM